MLIAVIIQARMASTRLPGKVLMDISGKPMLLRVIDRIKHSKLNQKIIIATSIKREDDAIYDLALTQNIDVYRGSQNDVLNRFYEAAKTYKVDLIVRVTADCPLIDPYVMDLVIQAYLDNNKTIVTNAGIDLDKRTYPRGLDVEVFSFDSLALANKEADQKHQREHVTPYLYQDINGVSIVSNNVNLSNHRWTVDTPEDMEFVQKLYTEFENSINMLDYNNVIKYLVKNPDLVRINEHIVQKSHMESQ
jgi:spore coat polysaccharide biosynthesis protein SpsF